MTDNIGADENAFRTRGVLLLSISHFIHDVYSSFLSPLLPLLIEKFSLSLTLAGLLSTVMQIPSLFNPMIGLWADRMSVRWFIIIAPSLTAIPMSLLGMACDYGVLLILLFIAGVSVSLFHVPAPVLVARMSGRYMGRGMSFYMTGGELARALGPMVAVAGVSMLGLEGFYPIMVFGLASSLWLFMALKDIHVEQERNISSLTLKETWAEAGHVLGPLVGIIVSRGFMYAALATFLPTFVDQQTGNIWISGISLTLLETAGVAGVVSTGILSDRFGRQKTLLVSLTGAPIALVCFIFAGGWIRFLFLFFTGFLLLSTTPVMLAMVQENSKGSPSASNGIFIMSSFMARSAITVVVGFMGDMMGLEATFIFSAFLGFVAIPFVFRLPRG